MPYELGFAAPLTAPDPDIYINDCCWGGDVVRDRLLPFVSDAYQKIETEQEDWGWFIWFEEGAVRLAIDIYCDDISACKFRVWLTSRRKRFLLPDVVSDSPELDRLRDLVVQEITRWTGNPVSVELVG